MSMTEIQQSAYDVIADLLGQYGLSELTEFVGNFIVQNDVIDENVLMGQIRQEDAYKERFAANEARRKAGLNVLPEGQYVALENTYRQYLRASGLPNNFYDSNEDLQNLIANDVSPGELAERVNQGYEAVRMANPEVVRQMQELYGVTEGDLAAYFLDPDRATPTLLQQAQAAQIAAEARMQADISIGAQTAEELAQAGIGVAAARQGFAAITAAEEVFQTTTGEAQAGERGFTQEEQVGAVFGTNAAAQQRLRQRARQRQAQFETGGQFAGQGAEITGLQ